ncbi:MAG: 16S rRNA (cytosine(1402)-N(4))-methyltransferase RsmH [Prolixibacteraceae bacterium]|jgi:16S rRNA (cytosine1402-N4)-methyltransferase|nr:16S rRNA (cytosine(1402)-N(4))-methyltransferase RsmH [Prolixibacteraceae bacterium]
MTNSYHIPVLLNECIDGLTIRPDGVYVDVTYGGGGHSAKILEQLTTGKLVAFDQDVDVLANVPDDERLIFVQHNFKYLKNFLEYYKISQVDGVLADLGVSSHDFDEADRGFSFRFDGALDMRMNQTGTIAAADVVNTYSEAELIRIFKQYGELKNARRTAAEIVAAREAKPIETTLQLKDILEKLVPQKISSKYLAKVFQSLRIEVNGEIDVLRNLLADAYDVLKPGGRFVVMSYHSLEDRLVKNFFQKGGFDKTVEKDFYGNLATKFKIVEKLIVPDEAEIERNPRARSAKLRVAEKI